MKIASSRKGSALLIVLGMLAFMVISAVSFSAFMRSSRLPSSYLRRTAAARQLAKAALAEAIERLDVAIGENAYPDQRVGNALPSAEMFTRLKSLGETSLSRRNYWYNNVFIGGDSFLSPDDTVSTLTLEGLAYIPPPLVNEARRYSRLSHAATWHTLGFDAGRYAYCAIDVSDCLDINRLVADGRRNSGRRRITVAHLCEKADHSDYETSPSAWENFMSGFRTKVAEDQESTKGMIERNKVPLVSLADWNLVVKGSSVMTSLFCDYLEDSSSGFYGIGSPTGAKADKIRNMRFVTDSLQASATQQQLDEDGLVDLASADGQPFDSFSDNTPISAIIQMQGSEGFKNLNSRLSRLDMVALYDYLDDNNVPVSLAVPTVERVPMVCAVTPSINSAVVLAGGAPAVGGETETEGAVVRELQYKLDGNAFCSGTLRALAAFPFRRGTERNETFTYDACVRLFFAPQNISGFRMADSAIWPTRQDFNEGGYGNGVFKIPLTGPSSSPNFSNVDTEEDAVKPLLFALNSMRVKEFLDNNPVFTIKAKFSKHSDGGNIVIDKKPSEILSAHCNIVPLDESGNPIAAYSNDSSFLNIVQGNGADAFALHAAVFIRVKNSDGKIVDIVPASAEQDKEFNDINSSLPPHTFGQPGPLLRFTSGNTIQFTMDAFDGLNSNMAYSPAGIMCPDPRFNHAPENWISTVANDSQTWVNNCGVNTLNSNNDCRDGDIFMFVSDQEYLQSVYELAFLPNLSELNKSGHAILGRCTTPNITAPNTTGVPQYPTTVNDCANGDLMWRTYRCYDRVVDGKTYGRHDFEDVGLVLNDGAFRVNPCSQSVDALMAAFANTPYDWWAASTNNADISESVFESAKNFNKKYAFSAMNASDKITWNELKQIATEFRDAVRTKNGDWEAAFDSLEWEGSNSDFCGVDSQNLADLTSVDRKFLYGFWRDSFANRQQLFLIFVRAEPAMMGGGSVNQTPPQLGARAVALVWRDPGMEYPSTDATKPHRTRILFYRQFE